ncbi:MAG: SEC-C domain-containing protein [Gammaproteobacteria bacterium]|nr:SEC-C domain-containing protein [Gammaproteobacteria bacterium]
MSFESPNNPCPCESGRDYLTCCANPSFTDLQFLHDLTKSRGVASAGTVGTDSTENNKPLPDVLVHCVNNINQDPALFPVKVDFLDGSVELVKMSPYWFSESTFLDRDRIMGRCAIKADVSWLNDNVDKSRWQSTPFLFHSAFCGSTLMVRALELLFDSLPLKESDLLSSLLDYRLSADYEESTNAEYQAIVMSLLSRRFEPDQKPVYKANDLQNAYITSLLDWRDDFPVLLMYCSLNEFIFGCLKTEERKGWISNRFRYSSLYFKKRFKLDELPELNENAFVEKAAAYWSFNMMLFLEAVEEFPDRVKTLDFNVMLEDPLSIVKKSGEWLGLKAIDGLNEKYELNWLMGQHAKNPGQEYSSAQRQQELEDVLNGEGEALQKAEALARKLLGERYPEHGLPLKL